MADLASLVNTNIGKETVMPTPDVMGAVQKGAQVAQLNQQTAAGYQEQQMKDVQMQRQQQLRGVYSSSVDPTTGQVNPETLTKNLYSGGFGEEAQAFEKQNADNQEKLSHAAYFNGIEATRQKQEQLTEHLKLTADASNMIAPLVKEYQDAFAHPEQFSSDYKGPLSPAQRQSLANQVNLKNAGTSNYVPVTADTLFGGKSVTPADVSQFGYQTPPNPLPPGLKGKVKAVLDNIQQMPIKDNVLTSDQFENDPATGLDKLYSTFSAGLDHKEANLDAHQAIQDAQNKIKTDAEALKNRGEAAKSFAEAANLRSGSAPLNLPGVSIKDEKGNPIVNPTQADLDANQIVTGNIPPDFSTIKSRGQNAQPRIDAIKRSMAENFPSFSFSDAQGDAKYWNSEITRRSLTATNTISSLIPQLKTAAEALTIKTGTPLIDKTLIDAQVATGDPDAIRFKTLMTSMQEDVGKAIAGGTNGVTNDQLRLAQNLTNYGYTAKDLGASLDGLNTAVQSRKMEIYRTGGVYGKLNVDRDPYLSDDQKNEIKTGKMAAGGGQSPAVMTSRDDVAKLTTGTHFMWNGTEHIKK